MRSVLPQQSPTSRAVAVSVSAKASPEQVAELLHEEPNFIWLDGGGTRHLLFRDPIAVISSDGAGARICGPGGTVNLEAASLDALDAALWAWAGISGAILAGWISYDVADELEDLGRHDGISEVLPRMQFGLFDSVLIADAEGNWQVVGTDTWREIPCGEDLLNRAAVLAPPRPVGGSVRSADDAFVRSVGRIVERIHAGDLFQTNLCRSLEGTLAPELTWPLYRRMRALNPAHYGAYIHLGDGRSVLSNSPELFLKVEGGAVSSCPIKGTRRRGDDVEEDLKLREELVGSEKDRAELAMVVDVVRNDLSRVCVAGSVKVTEHATVMTLPTLHHTSSKVSGRLRADVSAADILKATFPPASITGAPKIAAISAAFQEEQASRGPCMGAIGWISLDGGMELSVAIRTAWASEGKVTYLAGCGITADSVPEEELQESQVKASAFNAALGI